MYIMSGRALYWACYEGDKDEALKLMNVSVARYVEYTHGDATLHQACKQGWLDIVKQLIEEYECNPYMTSRCGQTPLHYACWYGHKDIFEYLHIKQHLNPLLKDAYQHEPLDYALNSKTSIAVYICQHCITSDEMLDPNRIKTTINLLKSILIMNPLDPKWKTANGDNILQLVGSSELCISYIPSVIVLEMLKNLIGTSINSNTLFQPEWRTANGESLLQLICESKTCLSRLSSAVILEWLKHRITLKHVKKSIPDCKTADGDILLQLVLTSEECLSQVSSMVLLIWLNSTTLDLAKVITPDWKTLDCDVILKVMCLSKKIVSQVPSVVLSKWLSTCAIYLPNVIKPNLKTADGDTLLQLVCQSEMCLSQIPSAVLLEWIKSCDISLDHQDFEKCILYDKKTADGNTFLQIVCSSETCLSKITSVALFKFISATSLGLSNISIQSSNIADSLRQVCESETCVLQFPSVVMSKWLSDSTLGLVETITPDNKTADGDTLLQLILQSDICLSHVSSTTILKLLNNATLDIKRIDLPNSKTADGDSLLQLMYQSESCLSQTPSAELIKWLSDTTLDQVRISIPDSKTADDDTLLQLVCQSNKTVSHISSTVLMKWLSDTTLELAKIIIPHSETADGDTLLQLVCQSKSCLSRLSSLVLNEWLSCTTLYQVKISIPDAKTADGDALLQLVCQSKKAVSKVSSVVLLKWIGDTSLDLAKIIILPYQKTTDGYTLLQVVCQVEKCLSRISSAVILEWLTSTDLKVDGWVESILHAKTADDEVIIQLICKSETCISQIPSVVLLKWLSDTTLNLNNIIIPNYMTSDGDTILQLICQSEICLSQISSSVFLKWLTHARLKFVSISLPDSKTAESDTLLQLILKSAIYISRISSVVLSKWLSDSRQITLIQLKKVDPHWKTLDGDCFIHVLCQSKIKEENLFEIIVYYMKEKALNPDVADSKGNTALHIVCEADKPAIVSHFLNEGHCNPNIKNEGENVPLDMAINPKIINFLCQSDQVKVSSKTISGWMNKWWIYDIVMFNILIVLVNNNRYKTSDGSSLLHLMCHFKKGVFRDKLPLIDYLLIVGQYDPNCLDSNGLMPLQLTSDPRIMRSLIEYGAKLTTDVVFKVISSKYITDSEASELLALSTKKGTMLWNPTDLDNDDNTALHLACKLNKPAIVKFLLTEAQLYIVNEQIVSSWELSTNLQIVSARNGDGYTALHLACKAGNPDTVNLLLSVAHCDPNIKSKIEEVPLQLTTNRDIIIDLIRHGAETSIMYESYQKSLGTNKPIKPPVKVFIVGNPSVGKSTLTAALTKKIGVIARLFSRKVSGVDKKTVGIVPHDLENDIFGRVTLYDFAGHREFYSGHAVLLQTAIQSTPPIFLLVVNLREDDDEILKTILYWVSFLENQCASVSCKPHIILVGSHADTLRGVNPVSKAKRIVDSLDTKCFTNMVFVGFVAMDCQYHESSGMNDLRCLLVKSCNELRIHEPITFNAHCFLVYLIGTFANSPAVTINAICDRIKYQMQAQTDKSLLEFLPQNFEALYKICMELNDRGHILLLKDRIAAENSYVVIDKEFLLSEISGTVFATKDFKQYMELSTNTGVVPLSKIAKCFPDKDLNILIGFLTHLEFCHGISDQALHQLLSEQYSQASDEQYYLFPGLISLKADDTVWQLHNDFEYDYKFGWTLKCTYYGQFFSSRFLQVLLLRLAFSFALEISCDDFDQSIGIHRNCYIWKNGIFWGSRFGMQTLVEVTSDNKSVVVLARFQGADLIRCVQLRSEVISTILQCKMQFCPRLSVMEVFIDSSSPLKYPLSVTDELNIKFCSLQELAAALVSDYECPSVVLQCNTIPAKNFLSFEPYLEMKLSTIQKLCNDKNKNTLISERFLSDLAQYAQASEKLTQILVGNMTANSMKDNHIYQQLLKWRDNDINNRKTYYDLRHLMDQYSVFAGRNVLVSCKCISAVKDSLTRICQ